MSKEGWGADFAAAVAADPAIFVPGTVAAILGETDLSRMLQTRRTSFAPRSSGVRPAEPSAFVAGFGPMTPPPAAAFEADPVVEIEPEPVVEIVEPEPEPIVVAPVVDEAEIFAAGFAEGERVAREAYEASTAACARMLQSLAGAQGFDRGALAERLRATVSTLVRQIVGECGISPALLARRVDHAIGMLADVTEPARLFLAPDDLAMLEGALPANVAAVADAAMTRGSFRLETLSASIEDGPALWLDQLTAALDTVALPD